MTDIVLGQLATGRTERDAVHIAVIAMIAGERLQPGERVRFADRSKNVMVGGYDDDVIGVVDPFLEEPVNIGETFWLCLLPNSTKALRHAWTHPLLPVE
jgi:hypothetical protein